MYSFLVLGEIDCENISTILPLLSIQNHSITRDHVFITYYNVYFI